MPIRDWVFGVICGSTATYVCVMLLGILLPSWPFNLFFTPLALACLLLQWSFWMVALDPNQRRLRQAMLSGSLLVLLLWGAYFLLPPISPNAYVAVLLAVLALSAALVYWRYRIGASGRPRALVLFALGTIASAYFPAVMIVFTLGAGCGLFGGVFCPYSGAHIAQPLAVVAGVGSYLWLWARRA